MEHQSSRLPRVPLSERVMKPHQYELAIA
jgi:hypothetical protein